MISVILPKLVAKRLVQSLKNVGNLGTRFLRKLSIIKEGLAGILRIKVANVREVGYYMRL